MVGCQCLVVYNATYVEERGLCCVSTFQNDNSFYSLVSFLEIAFTVLLHLWDILVISSTVKPEFFVSRGTQIQ
jgi:hypothetical protein